MNKRLLIPITILIAALFISGCGMQIVVGSGKIAAETREVGGFSSVKLSGIGDVIITQAEEVSVRIEAEDNLIPYFETAVQGDTLNISVKNQYLGYSLHPTRPVKFYISTPEINAVTLAGSGNIIIGEVKTSNFKASLLGSGNITNDSLTATTLDISLAGSGNVSLDKITADSLTSTIAGSGDISVAGKVADQTSKIVGSGDYRASDLESETATVRVTGSGNSYVWASSTLNVTILGSGDVYYSGNPAVNTSIAGSGHVNSGD
jgi:hypothetical protein